MKFIWRYIRYYSKAVNLHGLHSPFVYNFAKDIIYDKRHFYAYDVIEAQRNQLISKAQNPLSFKSASLIYRSVRYFRPKNILELGTSFGITTAYIAMGNEQARVLTIDENSQLTNALKQLQEVDMVYFNSTYCKKATIDYFTKCLEYITDSSFFIFDNMYSCADMTTTWTEIKAHPKVVVTIDLFYVGLVFFNPAQAKQHFVVRH